MKPSLTNDPGPDRGPLHPHISTYLKRLEAQGYKQPTLRPDALLLADLDGWLARKGYRVGDLDESLLERFLQHHMRRRHSRRQAKRAALGRLLAMLRSDGWTAPAQPPPPSPTQQLLNRRTHLLNRHRFDTKR